MMLRPELLNRIDKVIVFRALTKKDALQILDLQLDDLRERLLKKGLGLEVSKAAKEYLLEQGYDALNGARPMRRLLQETVEDAIAGGLLADSYHKGDIVSVSTKTNGKTKERELAYNANNE
jgi:ATP-dependent Clp protease ATP-binding subunit ClpA